MDEPVDTAAVAAHLKATQGSIDIPSAYHSNWLDNTRAKFDLDWRPRTDLAKLIDAAWTYAPPTIHGGFVSGVTGGQV
jgi:UDP-glucose 4-epimerase